MIREVTYLSWEFELEMDKTREQLYKWVEMLASEANRACMRWDGEVSKDPNERVMIAELPQITLSEEYALEATMELWSIVQETPNGVQFSCFSFPLTLRYEPRFLRSKSDKQVRLEIIDMLRDYVEDIEWEYFEQQPTETLIDTQLTYILGDELDAASWRTVLVKVTHTER